MVDNKHTPPPQHEQAKAPEPAPTGPLRENYDVESKPLAPPGSRDYVAGQPVDEAEQKKVDDEAAAKRKAAQEAARQAEQKSVEKMSADTHSKK